MAMALRVGGKEALGLVQGGMGVGVSAHCLAGAVAGMLLMIFSIRRAA